MRGSSSDRPNLRLTSKHEVSTEAAISRGIIGLLGVLNPVVGLVALVGVLGLYRLKRPALISALGGGATVVALGLKAGRGYGAPYRAFIGAWRGENLPAIKANLGVVAQELPTYLLGQIPLGVPAGILLAGLVLWWRARYRADWRRGEAAGESSAGQIERAKKQLGEQSIKARPAGSVEALQIPLGVETSGAKFVLLPAAALRMHGVIAGPSGFGKTQSLLALLHGLTFTPAARGLRLPCVLIDMKADSGVREHAARIAAATGRKLWVIETEARPDNHRWSPLGGSASEIRAKLIEAEANAADGGFSEPHYRRLGERFILLCAKALIDLAGRSGAWQRSLRHLVRLMDLDALEAELDRYSPDVALEVKGYINEAKAAGIGPQLYGIRTRYALIAESAAGAVLEDDGHGLDLYQAIKAGDLILFSLDAGADPAGARALGNLALQELVFTFARLQREGWGENPAHLCPVFIDEFSALGGSILLSLYARSRSAGGAIILATQDLDADLGTVGPEFAAAVMTNANVAIFHRQKGPAASARAEAIGTEQGWTETVQITDDWDFIGGTNAASGVGSLREADKFVIHPNEFKALPQGVAYVIVDHPAQTIQRVAIARPALPAESSSAEPGTKRAVSSAWTTPVPTEPAPAPQARQWETEAAPPGERPDYI